VRGGGGEGQRPLFEAKATSIAVYKRDEGHTPAACPTWSTTASSTRCYSHFRRVRFLQGGGGGGGVIIIIIYLTASYKGLDLRGYIHCLRPPMHVTGCAGPELQRFFARDKLGPKTQTLKLAQASLAGGGKGGVATQLLSLGLLKNGSTC
jgi:hypothetical protein